MAFFKVLSVTATITALCALGFCNCSKSTGNSSSLPLIATSEELAAAATNAGSRMVILDLYADWCGPCRMLSPTLDELAKENKGKADFYRVNVDKSAALAQSFNVRGIPYVVFMKNGSGVYALTGIHQKEDYEKVISICDGAATAEECIKKLNEQL
jgi:thioredoxin 1